jgi:GT2 family glycosyltransferase
MSAENSSAASAGTEVSIVVLNYNGARWIRRCVESLQRQTIFSRTEVILADNASTDGSDKICEELVRGWSNGRFIQHGENLGYCEGNNRAIASAHGRWLFILNNDAWLEPECLERLLAAVAEHRASAACPLILNFDDDTFQSLGAQGFDVFGLPSTRAPHADVREVLMPEGCAYLIEREWFERLGRFDSRFYLYSDELDLSFRLWLAGGRAIAVPAARCHHRGAANVNPKGGGTAVEFRTSDSKRFYANRNALLVLLKSGRHVLLLLALLQLGLLACEALVALLLVRRWSFVRRAYVDALIDCWRMRSHIASERRRLNAIRQRGDFWMLRFLRCRLNRWDELVRMRRMGMPKVTAG